MSKIDAPKLIEHLRTKWSGRPCQMCGVGNWNVQDTTFELREFHEGSVIIGSGPLIPVVPVVCTNCGNTILLNAIIAGAVKPPQGGAQ